MTYRVSVYCSNQDHDTCDMRDVCTSTMTTCKQYAAKFEDFQNKKFTELSKSAFNFMIIYIILTFLGHYSMLNAALRPRNVRKPLLAGIHTGFFSIHCGKNKSSAFLFQTRESILTLRDEKQVMARL